MKQDSEIAEAQRRFTEVFGSREQHLAWQIIKLSETAQPCDVTFYRRPPILDVTIDNQIALALAYGAGAEKLREKLARIRFSDGSVAGFAEIWTINPMPKGGIPKADLDAANMNEAEENVGPNGETLRQMIRETYHCSSREEEDKFLRRFIAS
ncbi:hypothetical protein [Bradyrhizobium diazoefficiens]